MSSLENDNGDPLRQVSAFRDRAAIALDLMRRLKEMEHLKDDGTIASLMEYLDLVTQLHTVFAEMEQVTEGEVLDHIIMIHLREDTLVNTGVPIFDVELCLAHGFSLDPICKEIARLLSLEVTTPQHRDLLIQTLLFIEEKKPGQVDWAKIEEIYPEYGSVQLTADVVKDLSYNTMRESRDQLLTVLKSLGCL